MKEETKKIKYAIIGERRSRKFLADEELKTATFADLYSAGWTLADLGFSSKKEYEENQDKETEYYSVVYWNGNNWKTDIWAREEVHFENGLIKELENPNPAFYFRYAITLDDGEEINVYQSNMSGGLSPYCIEVTELLDFSL